MVIRAGEHVAEEKPGFVVYLDGFAIGCGSRFYVSLEKTGTETVIEVLVLDVPDGEYEFVKVLVYFSFPVSGIGDGFTGATGVGA